VVSHPVFGLLLGGSFCPCGVPKGWDRFHSSRPPVYPWAVRSALVDCRGVGVKRAALQVLGVPLGGLVCPGGVPGSWAAALLASVWGVLGRRLQHVIAPPGPRRTLGRSGLPLRSTGGLGRSAPGVWGPRARHTALLLPVFGVPLGGWFCPCGLPKSWGNLGFGPFHWGRRSGLQKARCTGECTGVPRECTQGVSPLQAPGVPLGG
jgi:hypothetical protein